MTTASGSGSTHPPPLGTPRFTRDGFESSSLLRLLERPASLDGDSIGAFLQLGYFLRDATPFDEIRFAGSHLPPPPPPFDGSSEDAIDAVDATLRSVLDRLPRAPEVHLLSGGRDSRHLLFALAAVDRLPSRCLTIAPSTGDPDWIAASRVARAMGIPHELVTARRTNRDYGHAHASATELCADEHRWLMPLAERLRDCDGPVVDGMLSDVFLNTAGTPSDANEPQPGAESLGRRCWRLPDARAALERGELAGLAAAALALGAPLSPDAIAIAERLLGIRIADRASVERRIGDSFRQLESEPNPIAAWVTSHRGRRETLLFPRGICRNIAMVTPFGGGDLMQLVRSLPWRMVFERPFHDELVRRRYPDAPLLPFAQSSRGRGRRYIPRSLRAMGGWVGERLDDRDVFSSTERRQLVGFESMAGRGRTQWLRSLCAVIRSERYRMRCLELDERLLGPRSAAS